MIRLIFLRTAEEEEEHKEGNGSSTLSLVVTDLMITVLGMLVITVA